MKDFFQGFAPQQPPQWLEAVEKMLKGRPSSELIWSLEPDLFVEPYQTDLEALPIWWPENQNQWQIAMVLNLEPQGEAAASALILEALSGGVEALCFQAQQAQQSLDLKTLLRGVYVEMLDLQFRGFSPQGQEAELGQLAKQAKTLCFENFQAPKVRDLCFQSQAQWPTERLAEILQQIWQKLEENPNNPQEHLIPRFEVLWQAQSNYFLNLACLRALRHLWTKLLELRGFEQVQRLYTTVYTQVQSDLDPYQNLIASSLQAMSACLGGVSALAVQAPNQEPDQLAFFQRMARNIQHLLKMESFLDRVNDPCAGAYAVEQLTQALIRKTWERLDLA